MVLNALETAHRRTVLRVARHLPAVKDGLQAGVMRQKRSRSVVFIRIAGGAYQETLGCRSSEELLHLLKAIAHEVGCCAFISQREEKSLVEFFLFGKKLLGLVQGALVVP